MTRLSINEMTTYRWSFEEDVTRYGQAGISAIGVWRQKLSDFGEEKGIELLADSGMNVSNLLWVGGFTGSDGRTFRESIDDAIETIRLAAELQSGCLVVYSGARAGHTHNHARRLIREALAELAPVADDAGIDLAVEPMHPGCGADFTFLATLDDALTLLEAVDSARVKLAFDTYHLGHDERIVERLPQLVSQIAIVHLGDRRVTPAGEQNRVRLGEGTVPLKEIVHALVTGGYAGYFDVELMGEEIEMSDYVELLEHTKQVFSDLSACASA